MKDRFAEWLYHAIEQFVMAKPVWEYDEGYKALAYRRLIVECDWYENQRYNITGASITLFGWGIHVSDETHDHMYMRFNWGWVPIINWAP